MIKRGYSMENVNNNIDVKISNFFLYLFIYLIESIYTKHRKIVKLRKCLKFTICMGPYCIKDVVLVCIHIIESGF